MRTLFLVFLVAVVLGFAAGWYARARYYPSAEERTERAMEKFKEGLRELGR
jgi:hypothetical protein